MFNFKKKKTNQEDVVEQSFNINNPNISEVGKSLATVNEGVLNDYKKIDEIVKRAELAEEKINQEFEKIKGIRKKASEEMSNMKEEVKRTKDLVHIGFIVLLIMVAGLIFSFGYFIYENTTNQQCINSGLLSEGLLEQTVNKNYREFNEYKKISQKNDEILICIKNRGYFSYSCLNN